MKTLKFTLLLIMNFNLAILFSVSAQEYCNYDTQTSFDFGDGSSDSPYKILEQSDGKTLIFGTSYYITGNYFEASIARLNTNNTLDESFGDNGRVSHRWDSRNTCISAALQDDGKILIGGYQAPGNGLSSFRRYVARLNNDGTPDSTFGVNGSAKLDAGSGTNGAVVAIKEKEDGKVQAIVIGNNTPGYGLIQLDEFGAYDTTFSGDGIAYHSVTSVYWQTDYGDGLFMEDGSVIVIGKAYAGITKPCITKITPEGDLDSTFAVDGTLYIERAIMYNYAGIHGILTSDEDIIIAATSDESPKKYLLFKVDGETGELVSDFGTNGILESSQTSNFGEVHDVVVDPATEGIYVFGRGGTGYWISAVWKVSPIGVEESSCNGNSLQLFQLSSPSSSGFYAAMFSSSGELQILGQSDMTDETSGENQGQNFMIPKNSLATNIHKDAQTNFNVYPNPAKNEINITIDDSNKIEAVNIYSQTGQKVYCQGQNIEINKVDISSFPEGIYIIELKSTRTTLRKKIIVN